MFDFQYEQNEGSETETETQSVSSQKAEIAQLQNELTGALIGLARAIEGNEDLVNEITNRVVVEGLFATSVTVTFSKNTLKELLNQVEAEKKRLVPNCFACASSCGRTDNFDMQLLWQEEEEIRSLKSLILCGIRSIATFVYHAAEVEHIEKEIIDFLYQALVIIGMKDCGMAVLMPVIMETGKIYLK